MRGARPPVATTAAVPSTSMKARAEAVHLGTEAVERSRLDGLDGRTPDDAARGDQLDMAEGRRVLEERLQADGHPRGDGPAEVLADRGDGVEGGGGAEVDDDARAAEELEGAHRVGHAVGADLFRVVVEDRHAAAHPRAEHHAGLGGEPPCRHLAQLAGDRGHRGGHGHAADRGGDVEALEVKQLGEQDGELIGVRLGTVESRQR